MAKAKEDKDTEEKKPFVPDPKWTNLWVELPSGKALWSSHEDREGIRIQIPTGQLGGLISAKASGINKFHGGFGIGDFDKAIKGAEKLVAILKEAKEKAEKLGKTLEEGSTFAVVEAATDEMLAQL